MKTDELKMIGEDTTTDNKEERKDFTAIKKDLLLAKRETVIAKREFKESKKEFDKSKAELSCAKQELSEMIQEIITRDSAGSKIKKSMNEFNSQYRRLHERINGTRTKLEGLTSLEENLTVKHSVVEYFMNVTSALALMRKQLSKFIEVQRSIDKKLERLMPSLETCDISTADELDGLLNLIMSEEKKEAFLLGQKVDCTKDLKSDFVVECIKVLRKKVE